MHKGRIQLPVSDTVTMRIVKRARDMDKVRSVLGDRPIGLTAGYRDPVTHRRVGEPSVLDI
jgi:hypothetical protein